MLTYKDTIYTKGSLLNKNITIIISSNINKNIKILIFNTFNSNYNKYCY